MSSGCSTSSSTRPVPRRESLWGTPEGDHRQPKAHRCNDRAEDVIQACFEGNPFETIPGPFKLFWQCMCSKPGIQNFLVYLQTNTFNPKQHLEIDDEFSDCEVALEKKSVAFRALAYALAC
ncbi:hypothetical protein ACSBR2_012094 [Camellia fascicularis]